MEDRFETSRRAMIVDYEVDFLIQGKGAIIEVGAADCRPHAVDDHGFGVQQARLIFKNLNAAKEQRPIVTTARGIRYLTVYLAGYQDHDPHATRDRFYQRFGHYLIRDEVRV